MAGENQIQTASNTDDNNPGEMVSDGDTQIDVIIRRDEELKRITYGAASVTDLHRASYYLG